MMDVVSQIGIGIFGMTSIFLVSTKGKWQRWGYVIGLVAQPFWYWTTWENKQWGIFALSFVYTLSWINGIRNRFGKRAVNPDACDKAPEGWRCTRVPGHDGPCAAEPTGDPDEDYWYHRQ